MLTLGYYCSHADLKFDILTICFSWLQQKISFFLITVPTLDLGDKSDLNCFVGLSESVKSIPCCVLLSDSLFVICLKIVTNKSSQVHKPKRFFYHKMCSPGVSDSRVYSLLATLWEQRQQFIICSIWSIRHADVKNVPEMSWKQNRKQWM